MEQVRADINFLKMANEKMERICKNASELAAYNLSDHPPLVADSSQADEEKIACILQDLHAEKMRLFKNITASL